MESTWRRAARDTRHAVLDTLRYQVLAVIVATVIGLVVVFVTPANASPKTQGIWGVLGALGSVFVLVIAIFLWHLFRAPYRQRDEVVKAYRQTEEFAGLKAGDIVKNKNINIPLMFQTAHKDTNSGKYVIIDVTFERCTLTGPCIVGLSGTISIESCGLGGGGPDIVFIEAQERPYVGLPVFFNCSFKYCEFKNVGFITRPQVIEQVKNTSTIL